jgi:hypothetical protein
MPPDIPPELFTALVNRLAELVLADLDIEGDLSDELQSKQEPDKIITPHSRRPA